MNLAQKIAVYGGIVAAPFIYSGCSQDDAPKTLKNVTTEEFSDLKKIPSDSIVTTIDDLANSYPKLIENHNIMTTSKETDEAISSYINDMIRTSNTLAKRYTNLEMDNGSKADISRVFYNAQTAFGKVLESVMFEDLALTAKNNETFNIYAIEDKNLVCYSMKFLPLETITEGDMRYKNSRDVTVAKYSFSTMDKEFRLIDDSEKTLSCISEPGKEPTLGEFLKNSYAK